MAEMSKEQHVVKWHPIKINSIDLYCRLIIPMATKIDFSHRHEPLNTLQGKIDFNHHPEP
jgi:hypothetical protein